MQVKVIVGGQFGSEGKGKVAKYFAQTADCMIRSGGSNSGHTIYHKNKKYILRHLPAGVTNPDCTLLIPAGSVIDLQVLLNEIKTFKVAPERLVIDPNAYILSDFDIQKESELDLNSMIGSTLSGTGAATIRRITRQNSETAKDINVLKPYIGDVHSRIKKSYNVIIEGTQGFGLSLYHSPYYPYVTSRDTTAAGCCSELGISPRDVTDVILVIRTLPIRVAGNSGPLPNETTWDKLGLEPEYTSVTNKVRRVGLFDPYIVNRAIECNKPSRLVLNHVDYIENYKPIAKSINKGIDYIGTGPLDIIYI